MPSREIQYNAMPDSSLYEKIGMVSFKLSEAIVELIANSVDARVENERVEIDVNITSDKVVILDNAKGMDNDTLAEAVRLGVSMDKITGFKGKRKGTFGLGLKTACASIGEIWEVYTRPIGGNEEFVVQMDLNTWTSRTGIKTSDAFDFTMKARDKKRGPLEDREHGTAIVITKLRDKDPMKGAVWEQIGKAYAPHINQGDVFRVNNKAAQIPQYDLLLDRKWEVDQKIGEYGTVTGWVGVSKNTRNDGSYGFNLYRENQLMSSWNKDFFKKHLMVSRIRGELNLDFVPPNFHKKGFETQSPEWKLTKQIMWRFVLDSVAKMSKSVSKNKGDQTRFAKAEQAMDKAMGLQSKKTIDVGDVTGNDKDETNAKPETLNEIAANQIRINDKIITLAHDVRSLHGEVKMPWSYTTEKGKEGETHLCVHVNENSLIYKKTKDMQLLMSMALADCVTEHLMGMFMMDVKQAKQIRNEWLEETMG